MLAEKTKRTKENNEEDNVVGRGRWPENDIFGTVSFSLRHQHSIECKKVFAVQLVDVGEGGGDGGNVDRHILPADADRRVLSMEIDIEYSGGIEHYGNQLKSSSNSATGMGNRNEVDKAVINIATLTILM
ncbi:hypothetical protein MUK42_07001 [Musa troglodytarum]|uniref:Uncharacterized protein n=1 Tax=Musa troglodytarum TaxID=320322 RepID=A0A9E7GRF4_9LILI|nr:hypothetical protein MUK42_07001 [Musa troglodytarum]